MDLARPIMMAELATKSIIAQPLPQGGILWSLFGNHSVIRALNQTSGKNLSEKSLVKKTPEEGHKFRTLDEILCDSTFSSEETNKKANRRSECAGIVKLSGGNYMRTQTFTHDTDESESPICTEDFSASEGTTEDSEKSGNNTSSKNSENTKSDASQSVISYKVNKNEKHQVAPIWEFSSNDNFGMFCTE